MAADPTADAPAPRTVVVTGATGFIGSRVCRALAVAGHAVVPLVRPGADVPAGGRAVDLDDVDGLTALLRDVAPDAICHAAWSGHPRSAGVAYGGQLRDSLVPTLAVAVAAGLAHVPHVVLLSSGGTVGKQPVDGEAPGAYAWAKRVAETAFAGTATDFGFALTVLRPSAVYGPGQDPSKGLGVISVFLDRALRDEPLVLFGSGSVGRDYLHVDDLAVCVQRVVEVQAAGTFDVGGPEVVTLDELVHLLEEALGRTLDVQQQAPTGVDPERVELDDGPITKATGWRPTRRVADAVPEILAELSARLGPA